VSHSPTTRTPTGMESSRHPRGSGCAEGKWRWRCTENMLYDRNFEWLRDLTKNSNRLGTLLSPHTRKVLEAVSRI
jgi:hypothetical protein